MKKRFEKFIFVFALILIINLSFVSAVSIDSEIQKLTNYAQDYESGNINYVQLLIYSSTIREKMNEVLGATNKEFGGVLKETQLKEILGQPTEKTRWVWVENLQKEKKMPDEIPAWRKIIFDGKKIQLWLNSWPSIIEKKNESLMVYRLNIDVQFKKPSEQLNIMDKISEIKILAENYNKNPSEENAETLAQKSVSVERSFESYLRQNQANCEDIMKSIFGSENKRGSQKMLVQEVNFFEVDDLSVNLRLEMCDECEWHWININLWLDSRSPMFKEGGIKQEIVSPEQYKNFNDAQFKEEISNILEDIKKGLNAGNYQIVMQVQNKLQAINEAWSQKSNNVWKEADNIFEEKRKAMSQKEMEEYNKNYGWIRDEQEKRTYVQNIANQNYEARKTFYLSLFSEYEKKEFYFTQEEYEKRLVEEFTEFGKEMCDNNVDDNKNEKVDCEDDQCSGKICGKQSIKKIIQNGNETKEIESDEKLYCIVGLCQARNESYETKESICGNHICESKESVENCVKDCSICKKYEAINCSGKVIFSGEDENGCPLEPVCIEENYLCTENYDCFQPLCGKAECIEGTCKITQLEECKEAECIDGSEKIKNCSNGDKIISEKCMEGLWKSTNLNCASSDNGEELESIIVEKPIFNTECNIREDCGGEDDVCSNGKCITIPKTLKLEEAERKIKDDIKKIEEKIEKNKEKVEQKQGKEEIKKQEEVKSHEKEEQENLIKQENPQKTITGNVIKAIKEIPGKMTGFVISFTGRDVAETDSTETPEPELSQNNPLENTNQLPKENQDKTEQQPEEEAKNDFIEEERQREIDNMREEKNMKREEENRRREEETQNCVNNCENPCRDMFIMPCVSKCVMEAKCSDNACTDNKIKECESNCKQKQEYETCKNDCAEKCKTGERFEMQNQQEEPKMEKSVFKVGGTCRTAQGSQKTEGFIYFDGWGNPFEELRIYKQKYYMGGSSEWCKEDFTNLVKQRKEFEKGFNEEFIRWFFEKYMANSAEDWEQHISGIFELYWRDIDNSKQMVDRMNCLGITELPEHNLINVSYESEYGKIEFWEEIKTTKLFEKGEEVPVISPYMKIWVFPPKEFIVYEMKKAMENHEFPGSSEDKLERENEQGLTEEEKEKIKQNKGFMDQVRKISEKYGGEASVVLKLVDNGSVIFNIQAKISEENIIDMEPMLPEEVKEQDINVEVEFQKIYEIIQIQQKEMEGERIESPPWDKKSQPVQKVKEVVNGVKMYFKARNILNSAKVYPKESEKEIKEIVKSFFSMMMKSGGDKNPEKMEKEDDDIGEEKGVWEDKDKITGKVISEDILKD